MKKYVALFAVVLVLAGAAGGWWFVHRRDPLAQAHAYLAKGDLSGAGVAFRAAVRDNPGNLEARLQLASLQLGTGDAVAAEREARAARQLRPDNPSAILLLARAYAAQNKWHELLAEFPADAVPADRRAELLVLRASADLALNDLPAAEAEAQAAASAAPKSADPPLVLARIAVARSDWNAASKDIDAALAADPARLDAVVLKSHLLQRAGDQAGAMAQLDRAVALAPTNSGVLTERALLLIAENQDAKARADVDAAMKSNPRDLAPVFLDAVLLTRAGKFAAADPQYTKINPSIARLPRGYFFLALNKLGLNQPEQALDAASRYHGREPADPAGTRLLAQAMLANGRPEQAVTLLSNAVKSGVDDAETQDLLGRAYAAVGQAGAAAQSFAAAARRAPDNTTILAHLAAARMTVGDAGGASEALERSMQVAPDQAGTNESLVAAEIAAGNTSAAATNLSRLKARTGDTETTGNLQGMLDAARGRPEAALAQFAATAAKFPNSTTSRLNQARLLINLGRPEEAEPILAGIAAKDPGNLQAIGPLIARYVQTNRTDAAIALVQAASKAQPGNPGLTAALSDLLLNAGKPQDALRVTDDAMRGTTAPSAAILAARARALGADKQTAAAQALYAQILRATPNDGEARRQLIELLYAAGDYAGAEAAVRDGLKLAPGNQALLDTLLRIEFKANGLDGATRLAEQLASDPANQPGANTLKADALVLAGRQADAAAAYKAAFTQSPSAVLALRAASASANLGHPDEAAAILRAWLKDHPDDAAARQLLAQFDLAANRLPEAAAGFEAVLKTQPGDPIALNNLAWIYQQRNDPRAKATALAAYLQQPNPDTADTLGWIDVTTGDPADGLPLLRQSNTLRPNTPIVLYHLAVALDATGDKSGAIATLQPIVSGSANFPEKADATKLLDRLRSAK